MTSSDDTAQTAGTSCTPCRAIVSMNIGATFGWSDTIAFTFTAPSLADATTPSTITLADSAANNGGFPGVQVVGASRRPIDTGRWSCNGSQFNGPMTSARQAR